MFRPSSGAGKYNVPSFDEGGGLHLIICPQKLCGNEFCSKAKEVKQ